MTPNPVDVLDRLIKGVEAGDIEEVRRIYHPAAVIWHSNDGVEQSAEDNLALLRWLTDHVPGMTYTNIRRHGFDGGAVEQHDTIVPIPGQQPMTMAACLVILVDGEGRITRLDEYLDSGAVAALSQALR